jgi:AraC-like DNA-binding protein
MEGDAAGGEGHFAARAVSIRTSSLDHAVAVICEAFHTAAAVHEKSPGPFSATIRALHGNGLSIGDVTCNVLFRSRNEYSDGYHISLPITGTTVWHQGGKEGLAATAQRAVIVNPGPEPLAGRFVRSGRSLGFRIGQQELDTTLGRMIGRPVQRSVQIAPTLDVTTGPGREWAELLRSVTNGAQRPAAMINHALIGPCVQESLVRGLLLAADHCHRDMLEAAGQVSAAPKALQRVVEAIQDAPERPYTVGRLADLAGVSARCLQQRFREHFGVSPMAYLRDVRLTRAHHDLRQAAPTPGAVGEVAYRWGFLHLSRFAMMYQARYGVTPSHTLRNGRGRAGFHRTANRFELSTLLDQNADGHRDSR